MNTSVNAKYSLDEIFKSLQLEEYQKHKISKFIKSFSFDGKTVLEIGSDLFLNTAQCIVRLGAKEVVAVNPQIPLTITAPDNRIKILRTKGEETGLETGSFDIVFGIAILEHILNLNDFAKECLRLLKPDGVCFLEGNPLWTAPTGHHTWIGKAPSGKNYIFSRNTAPYEDWEHLCLRTKTKAQESLKSKRIPEEDIPLLIHELFDAPHISRYSPIEIENVFLNIFGPNCDIQRVKTDILPNKFFEAAKSTYPEKDLSCIGMFVTLDNRNISVKEEKIESPNIIRQGSYEHLLDIPLNVFWPLTYMCNYNCSYCFYHEKLDKNKFVPFHKFITAIENLASLNRHSYSFYFHGGEPTIYPQFRELLYLVSERFGDRLKNIMIVSNGSRDVNLYKSLNEISLKTHIEFLISIHTEHVKIDHLTELIKNLSSHVKLNFSLMFHPEKVEFVKEIFSELCELRKEYFFFLTVTILREPPTFSIPDRRYTPELYAWQKESQQIFYNISKKSIAKIQYISPPPTYFFTEFIQNGEYKCLIGGDRNQNFVNGLFNFKGMYCVPVNMIYISPNGTIRTTGCNLSRNASNIFDNKITKDDFMYIIPCTLPSCGCSGNDAIMKFKNKNEAENYFRIALEKQDRLIQDYKS